MCSLAFCGNLKLFQSSQQANDIDNLRLKRQFLAQCLQNNLYQLAAAFFCELVMSLCQLKVPGTSFCKTVESNPGSWDPVLLERQLQLAGRIHRAFKLVGFSTAHANPLCELCDHRPLGWEDNGHCNRVSTKLAKWEYQSRKSVLSAVQKQHFTTEL